MRRAALAAAALALALAAAGCGGGGAGDEARADSAPATVTVKTFAFAPDPITVKAGTTVTWVNEDAIEHSVTSGTRARRDGAYDEPLAKSGGKATHAYDTAGTYEYFCKFHPGDGMKATVVVR